MYRFQDIAASIIRLAHACNIVCASTNETLAWKPCPLYVSPANVPLQCANLSVPLDWDFPGKGNITLGIAKFPARDPDRRIGNLFYNPGGSGSQSSSSLADFEIYRTETLDRFDIIGVDVRDVGLSTPLVCNASYLNARLPWFPNDGTSFHQVVANHQAFRQSCTEGTDLELIDYMDTVSTVRDHEAVRKALGGDEKLTFFGQSYGTLIGSQYSELFPQNIRAMLLDGVLSVSQGETAKFAIGASGAEVAMGYFLDWCAQQNATACPAAHQNQSVADVWTQLLARAAQDSILANACILSSECCISPNVTDYELISNAISKLSMSNDTGFSYVARGLYQAAFENDATLFSTPRTNNSQSAAGVYSNFAVFARIAINAQDHPHYDLSDADIKAKYLLASSEKTRYTRGYSTMWDFQRATLGWPSPLRNPPHKISIPPTLNTTILLAHNLWDPTTPYEFAVNLRKEIGEDRAVLLTRIVEGHTVAFQQEARGGGALEAIQGYLENLTLPEQGVIYAN